MYVILVYFFFQNDTFQVFKDLINLVLLILVVCDNELTFKLQELYQMRIRQ